MDESDIVEIDGGYVEGGEILMCTISDSLLHRTVTIKNSWLSNMYFTLKRAEATVFLDADVFQRLFIGVSTWQNDGYMSAFVVITMARPKLP